MSGKAGICCENCLFPCLYLPFFYPQHLSFTLALLNIFSYPEAANSVSQNYLFIVACSKFNMI